MSKPTPSSATKKTASAHSVGVLIVAFVALFAAVLLVHDGRPTLRMNGTSYTLSVADTIAARQKGLGGRASMAPNAGMLFVFPAPGRQCFWMKDMRFSLDIIWTDSDKRVVRVVQNLPSASYPNVYCANGAQYVLELNAGQAGRAQVTDGMVLHF